MVIYCTIEKAIREDKIDYVVMGTDGACRLVYFHRPTGTVLTMLKYLLCIPTGAEVLKN
jgi:hypothetical protein